MRLLEDLGERRVRDLPVEGDDVAAGAPERGERLAVGLAGGDLFAELVPRELELRGREPMRLAGFGLRDLDADLATPPELGDRCLDVVERLAVEPVLVLDGCHALALDRASDDDGRRSRRRERLGECAVDLLDVVAVDRDCVPAERAGTRDVDVEIPADHRLAPLSQAVDVEDRGQVVELVVGRVLECLPHRALCHLAVAAENPGTGGDDGRGALRRVPFRLRSAGPGRASRWRRRPREGRAWGAPRAGFRACGTRGAPRPRSRRRRGRPSRAVSTRGPSRRSTGRSPGSSARRSRSGGSRRRAPPTGRRRTSPRWDARTSPRRSCGSESTRNCCPSSLRRSASVTSAILRPLFRVGVAR